MNFSAITILISFLFVLQSASAAVPLRWTVETSRAQPATFDEFAGATYDLEATLQSYGKPLEVVGEPHLYWQTNGMGSAYWTAPATVSGNVLRATWTPAYDVGARAYNCFIGITGTVYNAAFQLRLRPSPGALPNEMPLPKKVIDFSQVTLVNTPWPAGAARPLPPYLHELSFDDTYPDDAAWAYERSGSLGRCSAKREGCVLSRNYDWTLDSTAEFVVRVSGSADRFASIGVANCGTNLSEDVVSSGKWSRWYRCLPGMTLDGINANGVVAEINVCTTNGMEQWNANGSIHVLGAVRWALDHSTNAAQAAAFLAANVKRPQTMNFHYMIADERETWIVENGTATEMTGVAIMTNHGMFPFVQGPGVERDAVLETGSITNVWWTKAYGYGTDWISDFDSEEQMQLVKELWNVQGKTREDFRGTGAWWQTVHTSVYDIPSRTLRLAVQETDDCYAFALNDKATKTDLASKRDLNDRIWGERKFSEWVVIGAPPEYGKINVFWEDDIGYGGPGWIILPQNLPEGLIVYPCAVGAEHITDTNLTTVGAWYGPSDQWPVVVIATRSETTDKFALTRELAQKRDMDDLSYVTTVPGGWTPTEVDGHRYDIYYDGYSGWYVEKLTYYPEWGEWYYDDYEWVEGPPDAETLVAHKIWSDETITFVRQQVEVQDSLVLASQVGSQAETAARNYIQNNDIAKTKTMLRTGKPGEYGTGWGTLHYQFSSDRRWWSMIVPTITASWTSGGYVGSNGDFVSATIGYFNGSSYNNFRVDPISVRDHTPIAKFISSYGTNGSARCASARWMVGVTAGQDASSSSVRYDTSADPDSMCFKVLAEVDHSTGFVSSECGDMSSVFPIEFERNDYNRNVYALSNFRFGEPVVTDTSFSVKCLYDVFVKNASSSSSAKTNFTAWCTLNLGCAAESYITTNPDYGRVTTSATRDLFWDRGLKATWKVNVTNGCFFAEIVSTNNVTQGVN